MKTTFFSQQGAPEANPKTFSLCYYLRWLCIPVSMATYSLSSGGLYDVSELDLSGVLLRLVAFCAAQSILFIGLQLDNSASSEQRQKAFNDIFITTFVAFMSLGQILLFRFTWTIF